MNQPKRLQQVAYEQILEMILSHRLEDGVIYSETKLAAQMGVSRTPMRDALLRLSQEGYIDTIPSKGFVLHKLTAEDLIETYQMRCAIEGYSMVLIAKQSASAKAKRVLDKLDKRLAQQRKIMDTTCDRERFAQFDQQFHSTIVAFSENRQFNDLFHSHMHRIFRFAVDSFGKQGRMEEAISEHETILRAARSGAEEQVYAAVTRHMDALKDLTLDLL